MYEFPAWKIKRLWVDVNVRQSGQKQDGAEGVIMEWKGDILTAVKWDDSLQCLSRLFVAAKWGLQADRTALFPQKLECDD